MIKGPCLSTSEVDLSLVRDLFSSTVTRSNAMFVHQANPLSRLFNLSEIFNPKAFIYFDLDIPQQALSQIQFYEQNPAEYEKILNEPILANGMETIEKYFSWDESVGNGKLKSRIRQMMGLD